VDARAHAKLATGLGKSKFGIPREQIVAIYREAAGLPGVKPVAPAYVAMYTSSSRSSPSRRRTAPCSGA
jgi:diaminopimelate decarboxylase